MKTTKYNEKLKPLKELIKKGDYNSVKKWVEEGKPVHNPDSNLQSTLFYAASRNMFSILEILLTQDWKSDQKTLNNSLKAAVDNTHVDNVRLLLKNGASPESLRWYDILRTYNRHIILIFFEFNKSLDEFSGSFNTINKSIAGAYKEILPQNPELENILLDQMIDNLYDAYYSYGKITSKFRTKDDLEEEYEKHIKQVSLLKWTGCDVRKKITHYDQLTSALEYAIKYNNAKVLKSLKISIEDAEIINQTASSIVFIDLEKMALLIKCGLKVNDQTDGTSSYLLEFIKRYKLDPIILFVNNGAKLPAVDNKDLKNLRYHLFHSEFPPGIFLALAKILSIENMKYLLTYKNVKEILGDTPPCIIKNLYEPENSDSPDTFERLLESIKEELKNSKIHPVLKRYRTYCRKSDKEPLPLSFTFRDDSPLYSFKSLNTSKQIRPWIFLLLNKLVPLLEEEGVKFIFEEDNSGWRNHIDVGFYAVIREYKIPVEFHEAQITPKKYLAKDNFCPSHAGKLQLCHRYYGTKTKLAFEKSFFDFKYRTDYLKKRMLSVADLQDKRKLDAQKWHEQCERERREREELERKQLEYEQQLEENRLANQERVDDMIQEEEDFFKNILYKAKAHEECRLMRQYIDSLVKRWDGNEDTFDDSQKKWIHRANMFIQRHDPFCPKSFKTVQDIDFPDEIWDKSWDEISSFIKDNLSMDNSFDGSAEKD